MSFEIIEPVETQEMAKSAASVFADMRKVVSDRIALLKTIDAGTPTQTNDVVRELKALNTALMTSLVEARRVEESYAKTNGGLRPGAHDLSAARDEIGRRLARLRSARDGGGVSGQPE